MQRGEDHRDIFLPRGEAPPEHLVACADGDHRVDATFVNQSSHPSQHAPVVLAVDQSVVSRDLVGGGFAERTELFQAA
jgi:hypothetical protein